MDPITGTAAVVLMATALAPKKPAVPKVRVPPAPTGPTITASRNPMVDKMIADFAEQNKVDRRWLDAIRKIEGGSLPLVSAGEPITRFEVHHFFKELQRAGVPQDKIAQVRSYFRLVDVRDPDGSPAPEHRSARHEFRTSTNGAWRKVHTNRQATEIEALRFARQLMRDLTGSDELALRSASFGFPQVMAYQAKDLGYPTAAALYESAKTELGQVDLFLRFLRWKPGLLEALRRNDGQTVARLYNGAPTTYLPKLKAAGAPV